MLKTKIKKKKKKSRPESNGNADRLLDQPGFSSGVNAISNDSLGGNNLYDADLHFLLSLLPIIKAVPEKQKLQVRIDMIQLLMGNKMTVNSKFRAKSQAQEQDKSSSSECDSISS
jgi:BESS motif